ncbi:hypothetical protein BU26DRAFT_521580 [Trematosphaeria pertusa]|uniref:HRDC domain-containing protein n=1 Tax=Trematosphaeria pertusa TaxID=390896 RepID=A0A6A6I6A5_9PLEO|nr:uncharacterized protein BU26DRAFT_521580 [Trematosphaeria pertusa]KAF2246075.1 hypothetical protein BU26DRAFT_521580 [Trematosphaeria pertusa]
MGDQAPARPDAAEGKGSAEVEWPLPYRLRPPQQHEQKPHWTHHLYRGPNNEAVEVLYSSNKAQSEALAQRFLNEPILGFDLEWPMPWNWTKPEKTLKDEIALLQIASPDKIALFHLGLHSGTEPTDLICPSLRKIIESPAITKTGHNIMAADCSKLKKHFSLVPRAIFELSHLHYLVMHGQNEPSKVLTKIGGISLAELVRIHLGYEMLKDGKVRKSNWKRPLNERQKTYAAADAYAGVMLYHCLNAKRVAMDPKPPMPLLADRYLPFGSAKQEAVRLLPSKEGETFATAAVVFGVEELQQEEKQQNSGTDPVSKDSVPKNRATKACKERPKLDTKSQALFDQLSLRRKVLAKAEGVPAFRVASDAVLESLARERPEDDDALLSVKGIGKKQQDKYGAEWLEVIAQFLAINEIVPLEPLESIPQVTSASALDTQRKARPATPTRQPRRRKQPPENSPDSSPAFGNPVRPPPQLHTGLSFGLAGTQLSDDGATVDGPSQTEAHEPVEEASEGESDSSLAFFTPLSRPGSLKRKRSESPLDTYIPGPSEKDTAPLTPRSRIFRNKIVAFSRQVTGKLKSRPADAGPVVSETTIDRIVAVAPRTLEELHRIPGIEGFVQACKETEVDLLKNIMKFAPVKF